MKKRILIIVSSLIVLILAIFIVLAHIPKKIRCTMNVSTYREKERSGVLEIDLDYYDNLIFPSYVKGKIIFNDVEYTDRYTKIKEELPNTEGNDLFPSDSFFSKQDIPYNSSFLKSEVNKDNKIEIFLNEIRFIDVDIQDGEVTKVHFSYDDISIPKEDNLYGIFFCGPAQNQYEAANIAIDFGWKVE